MQGSWPDNLATDAGASPWQHVRLRAVCQLLQRQKQKELNIADEEEKELYLVRQLWTGWNEYRDNGLGHCILGVRRFNLATEVEGNAAQR